VANDTIAPVLLSRLAGFDGVARAGAVDEDTLLADDGARFGEAGVHLLFAGDVHLAEHAAQFSGQRLASGFVHVEQRDPDATSGEAARGGRAQARGAAGDDGRDAGGQFHG
jgi:hypothetical protein